jgi:hypothetical protein
MMIQYEAILRNKRCVLAYLMERVKRLQLLRWDVGAVLPPELKESLSLQEVRCRFAWEHTTAVTPLPLPM